jgi:hypothetical protein
MSVIELKLAGLVGAGLAREQILSSKFAGKPAPHQASSHQARAYSNPPLSR